MKERRREGKFGLSKEGVLEQGKVEEPLHMASPLGGVPGGQQNVRTLDR